VAYAGLVLCLAGVGLLLSYAFQTIGINATLATFIGLCIVGFFASIIGGTAALKSLKAISAMSFKPEKTIETIKSEVGKSSGPQKEQSSSEVHELQKEAVGAQRRIGTERKELKHRFSLKGLTTGATRHVKNHPVGWSAAALGGILTGGYFIGRKFWKA
jgi:uncharacterized membrane protein YhiD involved in acid resistance